MRVRWIAAVAVLGLAVLAFSQAAPRQTATAAISGKKLTIEYGSPSLKGRSFTELIKQLPADRMWRAGAEAVTTLATEMDLMVGGKKVPAGKYSLYVHCPENGDYSLVLNKNLGQPLIKIWPKAPANQANEPYPSFDYTKEIANLEVVRAPMKKAPGPAAEALTYSFKPAGGGTVLTLAWGDQSWSIEIQPSR